MNTSLNDLRSLIDKMIENRLSEAYTALPGRIIEYNKDKQKATVQPLTKLFIQSLLSDIHAINYSKLKMEEMPFIYDVPVKQMTVNSGKTFISVPVNKGDLGMIHFATRSMEGYVMNNGENYPVQDNRHHDLNDAYFIPGIVPFSKANDDASSDDIVIKNENCKVSVGKAAITVKTSKGSINVNAAGGLELKSATQSLIPVIKGLVDAITAGFIDPDTGRSFNEASVTAINAVKILLDTFEV